MQKLSKRQTRSLAERLQREQRAPTKEELASMHNEPLDVDRYMAKLRETYGSDAPDPIEYERAPTLLSCAKSRMIPQGEDSK
jgi:hypothetical protein